MVYFIWRHVTQKRYIVRHGGWMYFDEEMTCISMRNIFFYDLWFKSYGSKGGFHVFCDLDLWPML